MEEGMEEGVEEGVEKVEEEESLSVMYALSGSTERGGSGERENEREPRGL